MASDSVMAVEALGGELITYTPYGGVARTFKAIVDRQPAQVQGAYTVNQLEVWIPNDATDGVTSIQARKDKMTFKKNLNDSQVSEFTVQKILQEDVGIVASDGGMFRVMVQS